MDYRWEWWSNRREPGSITSLLNLVPNRQGNYETGRQYSPTGATNIVTGSAIASDIFQRTAGDTRGFVCTATRIHEFTTSTVTDRSKGGSPYTSSTMWNAAQYGDVTIYTNYLDAVQASTTGAFADLAGTPPKAKYIAVQNLAVALANYNDGVNTYYDGVWISDIGAHTTWTPSSANEAANFRLLSTPGPITGLVAFKDDLYAFKGSSLHRISYVGRPLIWTSKVISDSVGAVSQGGICVCPEFIVFFGDAGIYTYDGQRLEQVGAPRNERTASYYYNPQPMNFEIAGSHYEQATGRVYFVTASSNPTSNSYNLAFQSRSRKFGAFSASTSTGTGQPARAVMRGTPAAITAHGFSSTVAYPGSYTLALWLPHGTANSYPCSPSGAIGSIIAESGSMTTRVETDSFNRWFLKRATLVLGPGLATPTEFGMTINAFSDAAYRTFEQQKGVIEGVIPAGGVPFFDLNIDVRFAEVILNMQKSTELLDIIIEKEISGGF